MIVEKLNPLKESVNKMNNIELGMITVVCLLVLGLVALFGTLASTFVFAVLNWCGVDVDE